MDGAPGVHPSRQYLSGAGGPDPQIFALCFQGLAYSFWPYVVPERLTIFEAASAPESLLIILVGAGFVLPVIGLYTVIIWRVFGGKARELTYY